MTPLDLLSAVVTLAVTLAIHLAVARRVGEGWYRAAGALALLGHAVVALLFLPRVPYRWDIGDFHSSALVLLSGGLPSDSTTVDSFAGIQSALYAVLPTNPTTVAVFNGLCAVLVAIPIVDIARRLYPSLDRPRGLLLTVLFLPLPFLFLTVPMRDALDVLLFFVLLAAGARALDGETWPAVLCVPLWGALHLLRPELAFVLAAGAGVAAAIAVLDAVADRPPSVRGLAALATPPGLVGLFVVGPRIPVDPFVRRLNNRAIGGGAYLEGFSYETWVDIVLAAPARALYFQYAPFPLHVTSPFDLFTAATLPVLVVLTVAAYRSARECERDLAVLVLLLVTYALGVVGYGLIDSNFGTTARHRVPFTFILCILAAPTLERWRNLLLGPVGVTDPDGTTASQRVGD